MSDADAETGANEAVHLLIRGDARRLALADKSVQCVVTSPPYFGLRDYGPAGQIGLEATPGAFVDAMVDVFRDVKRVLRDDGTLWLNLGDSYSATRWSGTPSTTGISRSCSNIIHSKNSGLPDKNLMLIPQRVALALQADGWYLRSQAPWCKRAAMPESVTDRPSSSVEYMFLLTKRPDYYYDADAVRKPITSTGGACFGKQAHDASGSGVQSRRPDDPAQRNNPAGRNRRNGDWWFDSLAAGLDAGAVGMVATDEGEILGFDVNPEATPFAHFATMPQKLVEPCIRAGSSEAGACPSCGSPWTRTTETSRTFESGSGRAGNLPVGKNGAGLQGGGETGDIRRGPVTHVRTTGWRPSCSCSPVLPPVPQLVLDPFAGSGTTLLTARRLGRSAVGFDLSADYLALATRRIAAGMRPVSKLDPRAAHTPLAGQLHFFDEVAQP